MNVYENGINGNNKKQTQRVSKITRAQERERNLI